MSTLALSWNVNDTRVVRTARDGFSRHRRLILGFAIGFPVVFYLLLLVAVMIRYGDWANYITPYNWPANIWRIVVSTGSFSDMIAIAADEWLIEVGSMNYDYGNGVADWSLSILPHKLVILSCAGALIGLNVTLLLGQESIGTLKQQLIQACRFGLLASGGALAASVTSATVFSVVHCATPSWVGSLAVLGFDSYDVFALEPYGPAICAAGFMALVASALLIVRDGKMAESMPAHTSKEAVRC